MVVAVGNPLESAGVKTAVSAVMVLTGEPCSSRMVMVVRDKLDMGCSVDP